MLCLSVTPSLQSLSTHLRPPSIVATTASSASFPKQRSSPIYKKTTAYEILGVPAIASGQEIKTAFRRLARTYHPDVAAANQKDISTDEFLRIHAAYSTLSDPEKRAVYDMKLMIWSSRSRLSKSRLTYGGRNWETDQCW